MDPEKNLLIKSIEDFLKIFLISKKKAMILGKKSIG
jgi:hypothetical protein